MFQAEIKPVRPAPGRRGQSRQDDPDLHRSGAVVRRRPPDLAGELGAGRQPRDPAVDGMAARPLQRRVRQQPVPGPQQFFKWLAAEDELPDPMAGRAPPRVTGKEFGLAPVEPTRLERACAGRSFAQRRAIRSFAVLTATGIRLSEPAGLRRGDVDLCQRESTVRGKGGKDRIVKIGHQTAISLDLYLRARDRHATPDGPGGRELRSRAADRGRDLPDDHPPRPPGWRRRLPSPVPAPLQPHLARPRRPRGRPDGTQDRAGPHPRCSAATAPAPAAPAPAAPTTAS